MKKRQDRLATTDVTIIAHAQAMEGAYQMLRRGLELTPAAIVELALRVVSTYGQDVDRPTFLKAFIAYYPGSFDALSSGRYRIAPDLLRDERLTQFIGYARDRAKAGAE